MRKIFLGISSFIIIVCGFSKIDAQCDCGGFPYEKDRSRYSPYRTAFEEFKNSETVFIGEVVNVEKVSIQPAYKGDFNYVYEVKFKVKKTWKKDLEEPLFYKMAWVV